jgi:hypothetical protein
VIQVFLEIGVIGFDGRDSQPPGELHPDVMGDERRLDMQQIEAAAPERLIQRQNFPRLQDPVLRIQKQVARGDSNDAGIVVGRRRVVRRDQQRGMTERRQTPAEGRDGGRHAVDPRKVHIREHQDVQVNRPE